MSSTAYDTVNKFEETIAEYAGSDYAVAVDSCCNALFLSCQYLKKKGVYPMMEVSIPRFTYPGVACSIINAGYKVNFDDRNWQGVYELMSTKIYDGALRFREDMFRGGFHCLSFHAKKHLPIGRGGMILTDDENAYQWLKKARFDGRNSVTLAEDKIEMVGWNMYMLPEQAARGLMIFDILKNKAIPDLEWRHQGYPDLSKIDAYRNEKTHPC